ncbi:radical SAM protein [Paenibacillus harenae]|uniref:radical SAM protein n=1 Tax=Paenibacillus harenae TaxID=306543 RepID=UPI0004056DC1|nr:radical SAM protein [Paenibacillus harenae]
MTVELRPLGVSCNISCTYCYQGHQREAGNIGKKYDLDKMFRSVEREGRPFTLFGGEPLILPVEDLETIFRWGLEKYGKNQIQTNGILINDEHIRLFQTYNVDVGISIDGPGKLNDLRWQHNLSKTRANTEKTMENIRRICKEHRAPGLIITLHRLNAVTERLPRLVEWVRELDTLGVPSVRLHLLEIESELIRHRYSLSDEENIKCLLTFADLQEELTQLRLDVLEEMTNQLLGKDHGTSCVWHSCDPYTTQSVRGIEGNGQSSNCGRTNKDGVDYIKANKTGFERYLSLYHTPQEYGGCKDCRFFVMCKGQCPGTAIDGDWRNRSELCRVWKELFVYIEDKLVRKGFSPLSLQPLRFTVEKKMLEQWERGKQTTIQSIMRDLETTGAPLDEDGSVLRGSSQFLRYAFVGDEQRMKWEPRLAAIRTALAKNSVQTVANGLSLISIVRVTPSDLFVIHEYAARKGLHLKAIPGGEGKYNRLVVGSEANLRLFYDAFKDNNLELMYVLLGIPSCCQKAMVRKVVGGFDPLWDLKVTYTEFKQRENEFNCNKVLNVLMRPLGLDLLGYVPCSHLCKESEVFGESKLNVGKISGIEQEMTWIEEMLDWPAEWTTLHGIAELKTGIMKVSSTSLPTHDKIIIRYYGGRMASDAAKGKSFSFKGAYNGGNGAVPKVEKPTLGDSFSDENSSIGQPPTF